MKIADFIINIIASIVYDIGIEKKEKFRFWIFKSKEKKWICTFCRQNDGSILLSSEFEKFLTYHKPIDDMFSFVLNSQTWQLTDGEFIDQIVVKFKSRGKDLTAIRNVSLSLNLFKIISISS